MGKACSRSTAARVIATWLSPRLNQPVVIVNKAGANGQIGVIFIAT